MRYLNRLKSEICPTHLLPKLPEVPYGSKGSTLVGHISKKTGEDASSVAKPTTKTPEPSGTKRQARSLPTSRCPACGKETYGSTHGGRFCKACGAPCKEETPTPPETVLTTPESQSGTSAPTARCLPPAKAIRCFSIGFPWIKAHLAELLAAGWTRRTLLSRGRYKWPLGYEWGAAWADSWQDKGKTPSIGDHGQIVFTFTTGQQSIWPGDGGMNFDAKSGRFVLTRHEDGRELIPFDGQFFTNSTTKEAR